MRLPEILIMDNKPGFSLGSSGKLMDQYLIKDHMLSHYRKLYSAKAAVDCSVPKSMHASVKYVDQKRREQQRKNSQSGRSDSQRSTRINSRSSCSSKNSRPSAQGDYHYLNHSLMSSSPRISTSFHSKQIVYPSQTVCRSATPANHFRSASELSFRSPNPQWQHSTSSQRAYSSFQDPVQKTYSGDVLQKHAHRFTPEKPFTPRTLRSEQQSTLLQYRYYTPPRRKANEEEKRSSKMIRQETYHGSTRSKQASSSQIESPQPFVLDHDWSDVETDSFRLHSKANRFRDGDFLLSSSRISPEGMRSPIMRKVSAEEEELLYLEFITDVTNEILTQGLYSDRVLKRVFERHIDMNRQRLDENKMRHLLDNLQDDLQSPISVPVTSLCTEQSHNPSQLRNKASDDVDDLLHRVFDEERRHTEAVYPAVSPHHNEDSEFSLNDNPHLTCAEENPRSAEDDNEVLEQVEELRKNMEECLSVSETLKEQTRGEISDGEEF
ncbi:spermatogenesis-associated protein 7 [Danio rerio]|uniref:Spermatogenesis-associated 7 n=1 Tax=Danio rerio TaxID=7955 RepID=F1QIV7_DANRE|nr:spermatogenesis-associated protein 7 [Danio rerio]|eukprot:XP_003200342.3 spermatogenesis-associated protein 7 [Danio rerio]